MPANGRQEALTATPLSPPFICIQSALEGGSARSSMAHFWMICAGKDYMLSWEALPFRIRGAWLFTKN